MNNSRLKIVFFGTPEFAVPVLEGLNQNFQVVAVVTTPDAIVGRKKLLTPSPIKTAAQKLGIMVLTPAKFDSVFYQQLAASNYQLAVVASYGKILPQKLLDQPEYGYLNIHPSLLPKYRGATPIPAAILNGEKETSVTIIQMDSKMDHGPILSQETLTIDPDDTTQSLLLKAFSLSTEMIVATVQSILNGDTKSSIQEEGAATYCQMMTKEDGYFDINTPPSIQELDRKVRAFYPWPTAWTKWNEKVVKILPGKVGGEFLIQIEGKSPVSSKDFLNGYPDFPLPLEN